MGRKSLSNGASEGSNHSSRMPSPKRIRGTFRGTLRGTGVRLEKKRKVCVRGTFRGTLLRHRHPSTEGVNDTERGKNGGEMAVKHPLMARIRRQIWGISG